MDWGHEYGFLMAEGDDPPLVEATVIQTIFMTGADLETIDGMLRLVCWEQVGQERRVAARLTMPRSAGHALLTLLRRELGQRNRDH
jgi:hypothetical protein